MPGPLLVDNTKEAEDQIMRFVFFLTAVVMVSCATIRGYLCGVRHLHLVAGKPNPMSGMERLRLQLRGVKRQERRTRRYMLPLSPQELRRAKEACFNRLETDHNHRTIFAAVVVAFFGLLRCSEYAAMTAGSFDAEQHLCQEDVEFVTTATGVDLVRITIKQSKTDVFREGCVITLAATGGELCPVAALRAMRRGQPSGRRGRDPLFMLKGRPMTRRDMEAITKRMAKATRGSAKDTNTHSLRRGGASALYAQGVSLKDIMLIGRWRSWAAALYVGRPMLRLGSTTALMEQAVIDPSDPTYTTMDWGGQ